MERKSSPKSKEEKNGTITPTIFYVIDPNERGSFVAHVQDYLGNSVFDIRAANELQEDETSIFDDGWMKDAEDTVGLMIYLQHLGIIGKEDWVSHSVESPRSVDKRPNQILFFLPVVVVFRPVGLLVPHLLFLLRLLFLAFRLNLRIAS